MSNVLWCTLFRCSCRPLVDHPAQFSVLSGIIYIVLSVFLSQEMQPHTLHSCIWQSRPSLNKNRYLLQATATVTMMWMWLCKYGCMGSLLPGRLDQHSSQQGQPDWVDTTVYSVHESLQVAGSLRWLRLADHCSVNSLLLLLHRPTGSATLRLALKSRYSCSATASSSDSLIKRSSGCGASLKHAAMMVNDSKAV